jgi:glucosyl-3-phosphoglycerate phosphatase
VTARRLVVWRHGRTEWNLDGRMQGQADVPLDEVGIRQAVDAAARLASLNPVRIVSSDLSRTVATAAELSRLTGVEVEYDLALREIDVGEWAGLTMEAVVEKYPDFAEVITAGELGMRNVRRGATGENLTEVASRFADALDRIVAGAGPDDTVVAVTHGLAARVGICHWLGLPFDHWGIFGGMSNCSWTSIRLGSNGRWRIEEWNAGTLPEPVLSDDPQK